MRIRAHKSAGAEPQASAAAEPALDQRQIVQAALELLDAVGFDGLTMRSLAEKLGIKAASLYWHVRGKPELLSLLADEICAPMREPSRALPWRARLEELGHEYRRVLLAHRDAARVLSSSAEPAGPNRLRLTEIVLRALLDAGFTDKDAAYAGALLANYVPMFVLDETQSAHPPAAGGAGDSDAGARNWAQALPPEAYPSLVHLADALAATDADELFQFAMQVLISGLEARLAGQADGD